MAIKRRKPAWLKILDADYATKREAYLASGAGRGKKLGQMGNRKTVEKAYVALTYVASDGSPIAVRVRVTEKSQAAFTDAKLNLDAPTGDTMSRPSELVSPSMIRCTAYADPASRKMETAAGSQRKYLKMTAPDDATTQSSYSAPVSAVKPSGGKATSTIPTMKLLRSAFNDCKEQFKTIGTNGFSSSTSVEIVRG